TPPENFDALAYMLDSFQAIPDQWDVDVLLTISLEAARERVPRTLASIVQDRDHKERVRLRSSVRDLDMLARLLIGLDCPVSVLRPPELRHVFLHISEQVAGFATAE